ncbi:DNA-binding protein [Mycolicibacillus koreensis]|nr:DNA-binding protein [Mycolicibacillus koreensis]
MTENTPDLPLGSWLADRSDDQLISLLTLRPDLAQPPPGSIAALAARVQARQSINAACDELDFLRLAVLDALLVLQADHAPVPRAKLVSLIGERTGEPALREALADLTARALVWGEDTLRVAAEAAAGLPWHPGQVTVEHETRTFAELSAILDALDEPQRAVLDRLVEGSPLGRTRDAAPDTPPQRPVPRLLAAGLLRQLDDETVILPRAVGQVLRGEQPGPRSLTAPDPVTATTTEADVDATAAGGALDLLRELDVVLDHLSRDPVPELRSGGMGVREARRLAKATGIGETRLSLILQLAAAAGLIASGLPDPEPEDGDGPFWAPTVGADRFGDLGTAGRWQVLARTWLDLPSRPSLIGHRSPDGRIYGALSEALYSTAAPLDRRLLLELLAQAPPGAGVDPTSASAALVWRRPRWARRLQPDPVADLLEEAHRVGLAGRGALSTPGRLLLDDTAAQSALLDAMERALPAPVDHFLVQADLTVVVPGPLERDLADELAVVADVESAGAAMVYRVSESSIRRALDVGRTGSGVQAFFERRSSTPVPQGLTYLIDDVARRHGQLRVGIAAAFVRCEDTTLLAQALAGPAAERAGLRLLAPTVAVAQASIAEVLAALRDAGFAPAAEDASGTVVDLSPRGARVPPAAQRRLTRPASVGPTRETLGAVVAVLRRVGGGTSAPARLDPADTVEVLKQAAFHHHTVLIGYIDPAGMASQRVVTPVAVRGSQLQAWDSTSERMRDFAIHRITSVAATASG